MESTVDTQALGHQFAGRLRDVAELLEFWAIDEKSVQCLRPSRRCTEKKCALLLSANRWTTIVHQEAEAQVSLF